MRMSIESLYSANLRPGPSPLLLPMRELRQGSGSSKPHINPSVLVIVIILSVVFLCSGILHILARCLGRRRAREVPGGLLSGSSPGNSLRGQLQHLFSLHDSGVEQVFIDTLPVFLYGSIRGLKDSADCAVCLNEFANEDKLRLLPKCKHAFHTECIDTWLLSNSTCPLCRRSLLPEAEPVFTACAPPEDQVVTANATTTQPSHGSFRGSFRASLRGSFRFLTEAVAPPPPPPPPPLPPPPEPTNITSTPTPPMTPGPTVSVPQPDGSEKTLRVELGRVNIERTATHDVGSSRMARSYSMGSYEYIVDFSSLGLAMQGEPSSSKPPTHRSSLSDGIPELSSASHTPGQEDMFWASRGLDTPHSLSRVREIMTPSPGWNSSPLFLASQKQKQQQQQRVKMEQEGDDCEEIKLSKSLNSSPNPNSNASVGMVESTSVPAAIQTAEEAEAEEASPVQRPLSRSVSLALLRSPTQELGAAARKDKVWEVSVDVSEPPQEKSPSSMKSSPLNWLRGRGRRLVYSAASPSATDPQQQSPEVKNTL